MRLLALLLICLPVHAATLTGFLSGLGAGKSLVARSGSNAKTLTTNGQFQMADGGQLTIGIQPAGQVCKVSVYTITCENAYTLGGSIFGSPSGLVLRLNSASLIVPAGATNYKFSTLFVVGTPYAVSVGIQPAGLKCTIANAAGVFPAANITNADIACVKLQSAQLFWTMPTQNTDGTPLTDLTGFIIQYGTDPALKTYASRFVSASTLATTVNNLAPSSTYYFSVASVSASGGTGPRSNFAILAIP